MLTLLQGTAFNKPVKDPSSTLVMFNGMDKIVLSAVEDEGECSIYAAADVTKEWHTGRYSYQLLDSGGLAEQGTIKVIPNLLYSTEVDSFWKKALKAVDDRIAGKAIDPAESISVGDKSLRYMSVSELLKLRSFILGKIAEEEAEETGENVPGPNDQKIISYVWRTR